MSNTAHPAVLVVAKTLVLWEPDGRRGAEQANLIVCRLIEMGLLRGKVEHCMALELKPPGPPSPPGPIPARVA